MAVVRLQNVVKQLGDRVVIDDLTLELHAGSTVGLVGPNGAGKTTLFKLIAGMITPERGMVTRARGLRIGYLPQEPVLTGAATLHDEVAAAFDEVLAIEHEQTRLSEAMAACHDGERLSDLMAQYDKVHAKFLAVGGYQMEQRLNEIMGGLGFSQSDYTLPMTALSGGQKCRASLAKVLLQERDFLLLDEPTNHLDIDAVRWLELFLTSHGGGAVVISHDRYLLDRVADRIVEVRDGKAFAYNGNYSTYAQTRRVERLTQERQFEKDRAFIEKEQEYIRRFLAGQRSRQAQGRRTRLNRRMDAGEFTTNRPQTRGNIRLRFGEVDVEGITALRVEGLAKRFGDKVLFSELSFQVLGGKRLGITGPNGTGKSIMLKALLGIVDADAGEVEFFADADVGYYAQESAALPAEQTVVGYLREACPELTEEEARSLLGQFLFSGDDVFKPLGVLSGGEQSRLRLAVLMLEAPNMLILDEPTNHLDIPSREVLEEALTAFPGTIITVSHDRYFLDKLADILLVMRGGNHRMYAGNYSYYVEEHEREQAAAYRQARDEDKRRRAATPQVKETDDAAPRPKPRKLSPWSPWAKITLDELEAKVAEKERDIAALNQRFGDPDVYKSAEGVARLNDEIAEARKQLAEMEEAWMLRMDAGG